MLAELHCHSNHSDGLPSVKEIVHKANKILGAVAITDHNTLAGYVEAKKLRPQALLIPGVEITCTLGQKKGHILALGAEEFRKGDVFDVIDSVKQSGGITIISHPFRGLGYSFHQKEVWGKVDAIEVLNGTTLAYKNTKAYNRAKEMKKSMTSGSDAHWLKFVGKYACEIEGDDIDSVLKSIKKGRVTIPMKSTNAFSIIMHGTIRKSKRKLRKIMGHEM